MRSVSVPRRHDFSALYEVLFLCVARIGQCYLRMPLHRICFVVIASIFMLYILYFTFYDGNVLQAHVMRQRKKGPFLHMIL